MTEAGRPEGCLGLDTVARELLENHAQHCVIGAKADKQGERAEESVEAVKRLSRHG